MANVDLYTLSIGLDTSRAQKGATDLGEAAKRAGVDTATLADRTKATSLELEKMSTTTVRSSGKIAELAGTLAGTFSRKVLLQMAGVTTALGLLNVASGVVASGIASIGEALVEKLAPGFIESRKQAETWEQELVDRAQRVKAAIDKLNGPREFLKVGKNQVPISFSGVEGTDYLQAKTKLDDVQRQIDALLKTAQASLIGGNYKSLSQQSQNVEYRIDQLIREYQKYVAGLADADVLNKSITAEYQKQAEAFKLLNQGTLESQGVGRFILTGSEFIGNAIAQAAQNGISTANSLRGGLLSGVRSLQNYNPSAQSQDAPFAYQSAQFLPSSGGGGGGPVGTAIARMGVEGLNSIFAKSLQTLKEWNAQAERARQLGYDAGNRIAQGFEDAIFSGNKLRDVLQGILQDLERMAFRALVTTPLGNYIGGALAGIGGGGGTKAVGGGAGGAGTIEFPSSSAPLQAAGGGHTFNIYNINPPPGGSFNKSPRQQAEDATRLIRR